jgi:hypothetical protein
MKFSYDFMSLDLIEMSVKINSSVVFTSLDTIISTTTEFPNVLTTANGTTKIDHGPITSELSFILCFVTQQIFLSTFPDTLTLAEYTGTLASGRFWSTGDDR